MRSRKAWHSVTVCLPASMSQYGAYSSSSSSRKPAPSCLLQDSHQWVWWNSTGYRNWGRAMHGKLKNFAILINSSLYRKRYKIRMWLPWKTNMKSYAVHWIVTMPWIMTAGVYNRPFLSIFGKARKWLCLVKSVTDRATIRLEITR